MAVVDSNFLIILLDETLDAVYLKGARIDHVQSRLRSVVKAIEKSKDRLVIPTPVMSEILVRADSAGHAYLEKLAKRSVFEIASFDARAAIELAHMTRQALDEGNKKGDSKESWAKVKFDRQIIAIARATNQDVIYSDDDGVKSFGEKAGLMVLSIADLPVPDEERQVKLSLNSAEPSEAGVGVEPAPRSLSQVVIPDDTEPQAEPANVTLTEGAGAPAAIEEPSEATQSEQYGPYASEDEPHP